MSPDDFTTDKSGRLVKNLEGNWSFIPNLLPPDEGLVRDVGEELHGATLAIGRLDGALLAQDGINTTFILGPLRRREATLSSRIEGTITDEADLSLFEVNARSVEEKVPDVREVSNYLSALEWGAAVIKERGFTAMLIRQLHEHLLQGVRGKDKTPGRFRDCPVFIGGGGKTIVSARFVPPPSANVPMLIENLIQFMEKDRSLPPLVRVAVAHYQFEAIHPFRDGNGRVGRLLVSLQVFRDLDLGAAAVHISPYIEADRRPYYDGLLAVSREGDWRGWVRYILLALADQAKDTMDRLAKLRELRQSYRNRFAKTKGSIIMLRLIDLLFHKPGLTVPLVTSKLSISKPSAMKHLEALREGGVLDEISGRERGRLYLARELLAVAGAYNSNP